MLLLTSASEFAILRFINIKTMLKYSYLFLATILLFSCQKVADKTQMMYEEAALNKSKFSDVQFDNSVDFLCNMNLSDGVSDSAHYQGKVYGFCSKFCKADFVRNPDKYVKNLKIENISPASEK